MCWDWYFIIMNIGDVLLSKNSIVIKNKMLFNVFLYVIKWVELLLFIWLNGISLVFDYNYKLVM